jgi:ribosomal protein S27E
MPHHRASQSQKIPASRGFKLVCVNCDALGIVFDFPENAPTSAMIKCRDCGAPRGTPVLIDKICLRSERLIADVTFGVWRT